MPVVKILSKLTPHQFLIFLFAGCLLIFGISILLPRVDNHLIGSDGISYYAYLPSLFIDGDLDFKNQYERSLAADHPFRHRVTPTGIVPNAYAIGTALLWSPFFLIAHSISLGLNYIGVSVPSDGYGYLYESITLMGSMVYGFVALLLLYSLCKRITTSQSALSTVLLLWFTTNVIYYMVVEPSMAHMTAMFAVTAFCFLWFTRRGHLTWQTWIGLGALGGLIALVRQPDATFLLLPIVDSLLEVRSWRKLFHQIPYYGMYLLVSILVFSPQLLAWHIMYGTFRNSGYFFGTTTSLFNWTTPQIFNVLFSSWHGLFTWHPIFLFAVSGLVILVRKDLRLGILVLVSLALQIYVIAAWCDWTQGDAFGGRMFISSMPIFALGLTVMIEQILKTRLKPCLIPLGVALFVWNGLFMIQYRFGFISMSAPLTFRELVIDKFTLPFQIISRLRD